MPLREELAAMGLTMVRAEDGRIEVLRGGRVIFDASTEAMVRWKLDQSAGTARAQAALLEQRLVAEDPDWTCRPRDPLGGYRGAWEFAHPSGLRFHCSAAYLRYMQLREVYETIIAVEQALARGAHGLLEVKFSVVDGERVVAWSVRGT